MIFSADGVIIGLEGGWLRALPSGAVDAVAALRLPSPGSVLPRSLRPSYRFFAPVGPHIFPFGGNYRSHERPEP